MADRLDRTWETYGHTAGGLVYSLNPLDQARLLAVQFHRLVLKASEAGIPIVFPVFPRIATDWEYLHKCLRPILPRDISGDAARAAHASVANAAKIRVTREIFKDAPGNAAYRRQPRPEPHYPSAIEVDNIALRREISRLRQDQLSAQELSQQAAERLEAQISELRAAKVESERERAGLDAAFQQTRQELERKSIRYKMRRILRLLNRAPSFGV
jgi:hypothetical protein